MKQMKAQTIVQEEKVEYVLTLMSEMETKRALWVPHWQEVSQVVLPHYTNSFYPMGNTTPGAKKNQSQYDPSATTALFRFAAAMESMLTPRSKRWHGLRASNADLMRNRNVALWFEQVTDIMFYYRYAPEANYASQQHAGYVSSGAFGTSCLFSDKRPDGKGMYYRNIDVGELFIAENSCGLVDKVIRRFRCTNRQCAQEFGYSNLPGAMQERMERQPEDLVTVIHAVYPRESYDEITLSSKRYKYASCYVIQDYQHLVHEGGYRTLPYAVSRYVTAPNEVYGRSVAMMVLPSVKVLQEEKKIVLKQGHRALDPVLLAHDNGLLGAFTLKNGAVNMGAVSAEGRPLVHTLPSGQIQIGKELMDDERMAINDAFLVTLFQILVDTPQMTATEVLERAAEKGALLSPTMGRFQSESLGTLIKREYDLLSSMGAFPPMPPELAEAGGSWDIEFDAPLNRSMRAEQASGGLRTLQFAVEIAANTQNPAILDIFDTDIMLREVADIYGMPIRWLRDDETVGQLRQQRNEQQSTQQLVQALPGASAMVKALAGSRQQI